MVGGWLYDIKSGNISPGWSDINSKTKSPVWMSDLSRKTLFATNIPNFEIFMLFNCFFQNGCD